MKNYGLFTIQYLLKQTLGNFLFQILKFQYNVKVNEKIIVLNCRNSTEVFAHNEISEIENVYGQEIKDLFFLIRFANSFLKININLYVTKSISVLLQQGLYRKQTDAFFSQIPKDLILKLYDYCKRDYEMFGYPQPRALTLHN